MEILYCQWIHWALILSPPEILIGPHMIKLAAHCTFQCLYSLVMINISQYSNRIASWY